MYRSLRSTNPRRDNDLADGTRQWGGGIDPEWTENGSDRIGNGSTVTVDRAQTKGSACFACTNTLVIVGVFDDDACKEHHPSATAGGLACNKVRLDGWMDGWMNENS